MVLQPPEKGILSAQEISGLNYPPTIVYLVFTFTVLMLLHGLKIKNIDLLHICSCNASLASTKMCMLLLTYIYIYIAS